MVICGLIAQNQVREMRSKRENCHKTFFKISATLRDDHPDTLIDLNSWFLLAHNSYEEFIVSSRNRQIHDERMLQTQFVSRLAFVSSQIKDIERNTQDQIAASTNPTAECTTRATQSLQEISQEIGEELMEIASIARKDFNRIPTEFVHPRIETAERLSQGLITDVLMRLSTGNIVTDGQQIINDLQTYHASLEDTLENTLDEIQVDIDYKRRQMNYVKAEIFPILEYSLRFYQRETDSILVSLTNCT